MPQINTHTSTEEAVAAIRRDIERREAHKQAAETAKRAAEEVRGKTWEATFDDLLGEEWKINRSIAMHLGGIAKACEKHIALQEKAGQLATAHKQRNPINSMIGGASIPATVEFYILRILERAIRAMKSGAGLTLDGLSQP